MECTAVASVFTNLVFCLLMFGFELFLTFSGGCSKASNSSSVKIPLYHSAL